MDALWYFDPEHGLEGIWENALAAEPPIYNADFTEMTVKLRPGIFWSDGVEFTADDLVYTVQTQMKNTAMRWGGLLALNVAEVAATDPHTVPSSSAASTRASTRCSRCGSTPFG